METKQPDIITIFAQVSPSQTLKDFRVGKHFSIFGKVESVAKQYGIKTEIVDRGMTFSAPKSRIQLFAEKLHFSRIKYQEI